MEIYDFKFTNFYKEMYAWRQLLCKHWYVWVL